jgi:hypothetical protein
MLRAKNITQWNMSIKIFTGLILVVILSKVVYTLAQLDDPIVEQGVNSWLGILLVASLGFLALKLAPRAGFPDLWDEDISNRQRFIRPMVVGIAFGIGQVVLVSLTLGLEIPMVAFPLAVPVYLSGGILMEMVFHLIPVVLLVWFFANVLLKQRWQEQVFWIVAILLSLLEPVAQTAGLYQMGLISSPVLAAILFSFIFAANLVPLYFFRRYGFLAPVTWRLSNYLIWHIIWPILS